jgi:hypothetical protein
MTAADILQGARLLRPNQQQWLAQVRLDSEQDQSPEEIEAAWDEEIKLRLDEINSGKVELIHWDTVQEQVHTLRMELQSK